MKPARITVAGKRVNFGDGQSLQIPCTILFKGEEIYIEVLRQLNLYPLQSFVRLKYCQQSMRNISIIIEIYV